MTQIVLDGMRLVSVIAQDLAAPGLTPLLAIERALESHLCDCSAEAFSRVLIKAPLVNFHSMYFKQRFSSLPLLLRTGYDTSYPEVIVSTRPEHALIRSNLFAQA